MKNKIFYYRHSNNEIYEMKFNKVIINLHGRSRNIDKGKFWVEHISAEVAGLGTLTYTHYAIGGNSLCVPNIYDSIEKAIRGRNTNTLVLKDRLNGACNEDFFNVSWNTEWDCSMFNLDFNIPTFINENRYKDIFGCDCVSYRTWVWNGVDAEERGCLGITRTNSIPNSYQNLLYDLINEECIYNTEIVGYATREECVRANSVKVHRF